MTAVQRHFMALALATAASASAQNARNPLAGLDAYVNAKITQTGIAGLAVAVVHRDSVVYANGFGVRRHGQPDRVTPSTIFAIGSNTKLFTAVLAGMLVDDGRMAWPDPLTKHLPGFQLFDPWVTREITLVDALSHRSGLGQRGEMVAYGSSLDRAGVVQRLRYLRPNSSFRSEFGYSNAMFVAAGEAEAAAGGAGWEQLIERGILAPLGMTSTLTSLTGLEQMPDVATPHSLDGRGLTPLPWRNVDNVAPAGSINSNVLDMATWLRFLLNNGRCGDRQLLSRGNMAFIEAPKTIIPFVPDSTRPSTHFLAYGLGVMMYDYRGVKVLTHTGGIDGMLSDVTWVPELGLGIVTLTNTDGRNPLFSAVARWVLDRYLAAPEVDWTSSMASTMGAVNDVMSRMAARLDSLRPARTHPTLPMTRYAGRYANDLYGAVRVVDAADGLQLRFDRGPSARLAHWARDTFKVTWVSEGLVLLPAFVTFEIDPAGVVESFVIRDDVLAPPGTRVWERDRFARLPDHR